MRVFLCSYNNYSLAIPMDLVSSVMLYKKNTDKISAISDNNNTYISLPLLLNCNNLNIHHGIVLKNTLDTNDETSDDQSSSQKIKNKIILLTTEIECETEIPNDIIFPIQKSIKKITSDIYISNNIQFSEIFNGLFFKAGNLVLLLNPLPLNHYTKKELVS
ncbi:MAG: hypothetical protein FWB86_08570 [Treponema sp.]|nr:hypothetical protein [Treponema sp.]MCL2252069.1 hypothetical protein [Treponema sp.]